MDQENPSPTELTEPNGRRDAAADEQFPAALNAFERFLGAVGAHVSGQLCVPVEIQRSTASQCSLAEALAGAPDESVVPLDLNPFPGIACLTFGRTFVSSILEVLLGAPLAFAGQPREFLTELDLQVMDEVIDSAVAELQKIWTPLCGASFVRVSVEPGGGVPPAAIEQGRVVVLSAELRVNDRPDRLRLILPSALARMRGPQQAPESGQERTRLVEALFFATLDVQAVLKGSNIRLRDLVRLRTGMVLALPHKAGALVEGQVNGVPKFRGEMIRSGSGAALLVQTLLFGEAPEAGQSPEARPAR